MSIYSIETANQRAKRIYLSGPMTGLPGLNFAAFNRVAADARERGYTVVNPAEHGDHDDVEYMDYLRYDIAKLVACEEIWLLPGWEDSRGARLEVFVASQLEMVIVSMPGAAPYNSELPMCASQARGDAAFDRCRAAFSPETVGDG